MLRVVQWSDSGLICAQITETRAAEDCYYTDEETAACVKTAHARGTRLCAHARARDSVKMCVRHGVDVIYHGSYIGKLFSFYRTRKWLTWYLYR